MKQITMWMVLLLGSMSVFAQNIELSYANPTVTTEGMINFYEVDVILTSDVTYSQGSGQFFLDYDSAAFGTLINGAGGITYERPDTSILGGQTTVDVGGTIVPLGAHYGSFGVNDSSDSKVSFIWQQNGSGGMIGDNIIANTPTVLVHVKMQFLPGITTVATDLCFDATNPFDDQFFNSCGPYDPLVGFSFVEADCATQLGPQILNFTIDCSGSALPVLACAGGTTTYTIAGGWDNGTPDATMIAVIAEDYTTSTMGLGDINACELTVNSGAILTVTDGNFVNIQNDITIDGTLTVDHQGSVVQVEEDAITTNNGAITVTKITPSIAARNYIAMSSPMSAETRDGVYGSARAVFSVIPSNFIPFTIDFGVFPEFEFAENFLDDDLDYLLPVTGSTALPMEGIGQFVFPSPAHDSPDAAYRLDYTQGTLNSGTISIPIHYNGPATVNNYNLLGNPYASAIDVDAFIAANDAVNQVYYWEHLTDPTAALPGAGTSNFSMNDVSVRNAMMGVAAVNGGTAPGQFMASGQGFGIKADQAEMMSNTPVVFTNSIRVTGNNDDLRTSASNETDKLWLNLTTSAYEQATAQAAIGFTSQASAGFDKGYDSPRLGTFLSLFSTLDTGEQLAIQGREAFDPTMEIALGFATTVEGATSYTISIDQLEETQLENTPVFLLDNLLGTITNLKETTYTFASSRGMHTARFTIVFQERDVLGGDDEVRFRESITLYPNPATDQFTLSYVGTETLQKAVITDINGKIVMTVDLDAFNGSKTIEIQELARGMYFIQIDSQKDTVVKKFLVR
jgi:hypothetical protein